MTEPVIVACVQTNAGNGMAENIVAAQSLVRAAHARGARLIALPECVSMMEPRGRLILEKAVAEESHPALAAFSGLAAELDSWLLIGSLTVDIGGDRVANRSFLVDPAGAIVVRYDKIHMFDVDLPGGESFRESRTYRPGDGAVLAPTPWGGLGLTICYDVRFPHLYRSLAKAGASLIAVPSAFTRQTGAAHWHVLLRARAIETGCYVLAPAQCGAHPGGRTTYGHSLIVGPWGDVLADGGEEPGVVTATVDLSKVVAARANMPALDHDRQFAAPHGIAAARVERQVRSKS
ncbi:MAG: carbon-nitrogen hydrolase family protein [Alphaproteobacteria bacterium]